MATDFIQQLTTATSDEERAAIMLEMSLSALSLELQTAVQAAAVPHWFDAPFLEALLGAESDDLYAQLLQLSFVEQVPGRGYSIHELTRRQVLAALWRDEPDHFRALSGRAADYCAAQAAGGTSWQAEEMYHRLLSDPEAGVAALRGLATKWANYEYHTYEEIEWAVRLANEQIEAGRLTGAGANWTCLWQAKLALIYGRPDFASAPLAQITLTHDSDPMLVAELAQTEGDMLAKTGDREGMAAAWQRSYLLYRNLAEGRLDAYLVAEKLRQEGLPLPPAEIVVETTPPTPPGRDALRLIDNIAAAWIEGVLKTTLDEKIDLRMARDSHRPTNLVYHRPQSVDRPLATGQRLSGLFAAASNLLLILGAPGSGKTITLLQLLEELLQQARQDGSAPIPLLFNLSSFATFARDKKADLGDWLAEQAYNQYRLKRQTTREELQQGRFVLLLDGLDEVTAEDGRREQCVLAINDFMQTAPCGLVVCSRIGDYQALHSQLAVGQALVLQPLGNRQIEAFIAQQDSVHRAGMQAAIAADWQLQEALRSPLLLNLYPRAFPAMAVVSQTNRMVEMVETRRQALFAAYVETVFDESIASARLVESLKLNQSTYPKEKCVDWVRFLANRMQQVGTSLFYVEELQPTWLLPNLVNSYRGLYGLINGLINGLIFLLINGLFLLLMNWYILGLSNVLVAGLCSGIGEGIAVRLTTRLNRPWLRLGMGLLISVLALVLTVVPIYTLIIRPSAKLSEILIFVLILVLIAGLGLMVSSGIASWGLYIQLREQVRLVRPNWRRVTRYLGFGCLYGLIVGLLVSLIVDLSDLSIGVRIGNLGEELIIGLTAGSIVGLSGGMLAFLDTPYVDERPNPGRGVRVSLRNAFLMTIMAALFFGLLTWWIEQKFEQDFLILFLVLLNILPPTFTWFGGLAWCQHWALRFMLWRRGSLPWRLVPWLNEMVARRLLRRVGGGYIFIHRSLLEYFAELGNDNE